MVEPLLKHLQKAVTWVILVLSPDAIHSASVNLQLNSKMVPFLSHGVQNASNIWQVDSMQSPCIETGKLIWDSFHHIGHV